MLANGVADFDQPTTVFRHFQNVRRGEILGGIWGGIAERLEQPGMNQRRDVMRLAVQHPASLLRRQADRQLAQKGQKPMLIFFHSTNQSQECLENERKIL